MVKFPQIQFKKGLGDKLSDFFNYHLSFITDHLSFINNRLSFGRRFPIINYKLSFGRRSLVINYKLLVIVVLVGVVLALGGGVYIAAQNGWFGGGAAIPEDTMTRGLVGSWSFDEGKGQVANDASGNGNNGTLGSSAIADSADPEWVTGKNAGALRFDGKNDYIEKTSFSGLSSSAITVEAWVKGNFNSNWVRILNHEWESSSGSWLLFLKNSEVDFGLYTTSQVKAIKTIALNNNTWYHIVGTYDGTTVKVYVNGVLGVSQPVSTSLDSSGNIDVGGKDAGSFNGLIDDVHIYNLALTEAEVKYHYNQGGPVGYWRFDEGSGLKARDESGNNNDGTLTNFNSTDSGTAEAGAGTTLTDNDKAWTVNQWTNGTIAITAGTGSGQTRAIASNTATVITVSSAWTANPDATSVYSLTQANPWTDGKYGGAIQFDGKDDVIDVGTNNSIKPTKDITLEFWVKPGASQNTYADIYGNHVGGGFVVQQNVSQLNKFYFTYNNGSSFQGIGLVTQLNTGQWNHFVVQKNGTVVRHYLNGVFVGQVSVSGDIYYAANEHMYIGNGYTGLSRVFNGTIDETRVYDYARTADEIRLDYQAGMATHLGPTGKTCAQDPASCMDKGLVGYWSMDEGGGTTVKDKSGNGNNGTLTSGPKWVSGKNGGALKFDGKDDYVNCGNNNSLAPKQSVSVEAWVNLQNKNDYQRIVNKGDVVAGSPQIGYELIYYSTGTISFRVLGSAGVGIGANYTFIKWNQWVHLVGVFDGTTNTARIYENGIEANNTNNVAGAGDISNSNNLYIGARQGASVQFAKGVIDDVKIYTRALSPEEVRYHYNDGGPVGYWKFDEGSGLKARDDSGNNNDGIISGATWTDGKYGGAIQFDGVNDYVLISGKGSLNFTGNITLSSWVKMKAVPATYGNIYSSASENLTPYKRVQYAVNSSGRVSYWNGSIYLLNYYLPIDQWVNLTISISGTNLSFYVNGVLTDSKTVSVPDTVSQNPIIGSTTSGVERFNGSIDEVKVYNYARTADDIRTDYQAGMATHLGPSGQTCALDPASCMSKGLVGYWDMDEGSGTTAKDKSGNGNNCTFISSPKWVSGKKAGALQFDGKDDYLNCGSSSSLNSINTNNKFTYAVWLYSRGTVTGGQDIIGFNGYNPYWGYSLELGSGSPYLIWQDSSGNWVTVNSGLTIPNNKWTFVAATYDASAGKTIFYVDGSTSTISMSQTTGNTGGSPFRFNVIGWRRFPGIMDEVFVYNRALSPEEVRYHYNQGEPVAHWAMDEGKGTKAFDDSGNNNDGTITGATWVSGKYGSALSFNNISNYITLANEIALPGEFTIEFWGNRTNNNGYDMVIGHATENAKIGYNTGNDKVYVRAVNGGSADYSIPVSTGAWNHVTVRRDSNNKVDVFINAATPKRLFSDAAQAGTFKAKLIGNDGASGNYFGGTLDDVRIYNYARTAAQIQVDYNAGVATHLK